MSFVPPAVASQPVRPPKPSYLAGCTAGTSTRPVTHPQTQSLGRRAGPAIMLPEGAGYEQSMEKAVASFRKAVGDTCQSVPPGGVKSPHWFFKCGFERPFLSGFQIAGTAPRPKNISPIPFGLRPCFSFQYACQKS